jgi:hypothetical protein
MSQVVSMLRIRRWLLPVDGPTRHWEISLDQPTLGTGRHDDWHVGCVTWPSGRSAASRGERRRLCRKS